MELAVSIVNYNTKELTKTCVASIFKDAQELDLEVWIVDNASSDGSLEYLKKNFPKAHFIESNKNLGFAGGNNRILKKVKAEYYLLLNSDTELQKGALEGLINFGKKNNFGIFSCKLVNKDGSFQPNGGDLPIGISLLSWIAALDDFLPMVKTLLPSFHRKFGSYYKNGRELGWVGGTAMMIKAEVIKKIGVLDEKIFMYGEDVEYCMRAKKRGFKIGWTDQASVMHLGGGSSKEPREKQWTGEFKGLLYIYGKYFGVLNKSILRLIIWIFTILRIIAFLVTGKTKTAKIYARVLGQL